MKHGIDKSILKGTIKIFDNTKTNMVEPDRDRLANGWQYQDKAFAEYFNFFWNETSSSLNQINPFILDFSDEILQLKSFMVAEGMSASLFDPAQNNWFGKVGEYLSKAIKKEATDRASALLSLQNTVLGKIDEEKNARVQAVNKLTTDLEAEVKNRTDADLALKTSLEGKITEETNARNQLATTLRQEIATASTEDRKWANLTGRPSIFPTNWDNVANKPNIIFTNTTNEKIALGLLNSSIYIDTNFQGKPIGAGRGSSLSLANDSFISFFNAVLEIRGRIKTDMKDIAGGETDDVFVGYGGGEFEIYVYRVTGGTSSEAKINLNFTGSESFAMWTNKEKTIHYTTNTTLSLKRGMHIITVLAY